MSEKSRQQAIADAGATIVAELTAIRKELEAIRALLARQAGKADSKAASGEDYWPDKDKGLTRKEAEMVHPCEIYPELWPKVSQAEPEGPDSGESSSGPEASEAESSEQNEQLD